MRNTGMKIAICVAIASIMVFTGVMGLAVVAIAITATTPPPPQKKQVAQAPPFQQEIKQEQAPPPAKQEPKKETPQPAQLKMPPNAPGFSLPYENDLWKVIEGKSKEQVKALLGRPDYASEISWSYHHKAINEDSQREHAIFINWRAGVARRGF